ncbi:hypothetical protein J2Y69_000138 [Microbacterium resistens]|uniref:Transcriptional regulator, AbiEi antitoxin, Type IV TA system n=1 Tax=Microbacterium resistens TaxID=156977 RepID=A0ABU1S7F0_9MICO|nr:hypothetical protein [Microbacterium resistens]MDR6865556.1 hypothetical protein [Microbacterium resistens]
MLDRDVPLPAAPIPLLRADAAGSAASLSRSWHRGELTRVMPGVYAELGRWRSATPWEQYLAKVLAVAEARPNAVFSHVSAAALRGVVIGGPEHPVHVLDPAGTSRLTGAVRTHTTDEARDVDRLDGLLVTSVEETIVDLARSRPPAEGLAYANALLRTAPDVVAEQLRARNESRRSARNRNRARWALSRASGVPETVLESLSLAVIEWAGFDLPELQTVFRVEGHEDRVDFFWPSLAVAGEADGMTKYSGAHGDPGLAILQEKRREARLRRHLREVVRWGWDDARTSRPLIGLLSQTGVPRVRPVQSAMLATLTSFGR